MPREMGIFETRPICVSCERVMTCWKNGVLVVRYQEGKPTAMAEGDEFKCEICSKRIVVGCGNKQAVDLEAIDDAERHGLLRRVVA